MWPVLLAQLPPGDAAGTAGNVPAIIGATTAFLVAVLGILYRETSRKDSRVDRVTAEQIKDLKADRDLARRQTADAYEERDLWQNKVAMLNHENNQLRLTIARMGGTTDPTGGPPTPP